MVILLIAKFNYFVFSCGIKICLEDNDNYDAQNYSLEHQIKEYDPESNYRMTHPIDEMLRQWTNENTDATWETNDQINFTKTNNRGNKINDRPEEDADMGDEQEANTDIMDGGPEPGSEGECDNEQDTDTDIMDGGLDRRRWR